MNAVNFTQTWEQSQTPDAVQLFQLFLDSSVRFRKGKPERVGMLRFFVKKFFRWSDERFDHAFEEMKHLGLISLCDGGIRKSSGEFKQSDLKRIRKYRRCVYCNKQLTTENATKDHVFPKSRGGGDGENIVGCCFVCNSAKADRTPAEWAWDLLNYRRRLILKTPPRSKYMVLRLKVLFEMLVSFWRAS